MKKDFKIIKDNQEIIQVSANIHIHFHIPL